MVKRFKVIKDPPMSNMAPASDYIMAQKLAKLREDIFVLDDQKKANGGKESWQCQMARKSIELKTRKLFEEHDKQVAEFEEWIRNGRPNL